ncbi:hypothetical protein MFLAVUS_004941 [Mucor flavus]|uniref:Uncharacterized protein n=1 Tax=Mucor flavus TaxID=439312 RepID=A0ABP9YXE1_9FUNG
MYGSCNEDNVAAKLCNDLSTMSDLLITMNASLMFFDRTISSMIETVQDNFIATSFGKHDNVGVQIESLIQIIRKLQSLLKTIQREISQNESLTF